MSQLSMNEHLEGILSDFEALKRSFEIEDVDDVPSSSASPVSTPLPPPSSHYFLGHGRGSEGHGGDIQSPSLVFNNNNNGLGSATHRPCLSLGSSPSPVLRSRAVASSLSFNRGTLNKPSFQPNGSSVARASSFQSRLNPSSYSLLSGPGSDNDSLHSSTSSLEYSAPSINRLGSYPSPPRQGENHPPPPQIQRQLPEEDPGLIINHNLKKFSSHGSVFRSEMDQSAGMVLSPPQPRGVNHGSMPSLDLQVRDGRVGVHRGGGQVSPGLRYASANANWNGNLHNNNSFGVESYQQHGQKVLKVPQPKIKETPRLNKFPLDLDNLVSSSAAKPPTKAQEGPVKPPLRSPGGVQNFHTPPPTPASPHASLSSLEGSSDTMSHHSPVLPFTPCSPVSSPKMRCSPVHLHPSRSPQIEVFPGSSIFQMSSSPPGLNRSPNPSSCRGFQDGPGETGDSVGSILQRIASFSRPGGPEGPEGPEPAGTQSNGSWSSSSVEFPAVVPSVALRRQRKKSDDDGAAELEAEILPHMEERDQEATSILKLQEAEGPEQAPSSATQNAAQQDTERNGSDERLSTEEKETEEEMREEAEVEVEMTMEMKVELGQQVSVIRGSDLFGYVGIEAVLDQMRRKTMKAGFEFNIMVVGQSGLGKSTLVNTLFKSKVSRKSCVPNHTEEISKTVRLQSVSHLIEEKGVKMKLTVIDTPGFGDQINNENCWEPIVKYVNEQYENFLREELHVKRKRRIPDSRVHCCIYFLPATGHRLRPIDVEFMKRLGNIVSIVPVIAKADTLTIEERLEFKERIRQDLLANGIQVYPQKEYDEDPEEFAINERIRENIPFAVVGTDKEHQVNGNKVLGRKTNWGIIEVENVAHCEFSNLRDLLIRTHLQDLKDVTHNIHYESYRIRRLNDSNASFSETDLRSLQNGNAFL